MITIKEPFWKYNALGIKMDAFIGHDEVQVQCSYKDKNKHYVYPHIYKVRRNQAEVAHKHIVRKRDREIELAVIPVEKLEIVKERPNDHKEEQ